MYKVFVNERPIVLSNTPLGLENGPGFAYENPKHLSALYRAFKEKPTLEGITVFADDFEVLKDAFWGMFKEIEAAGGIVQNLQGEYLFIKRLGFWDLPKGKLDKGEAIRDAAVREVEEECGITGLTITAEAGKTYHTYTHKEKEVLKVTHWFYMQTDFTGNLIPQAEEDITEARWFTKAEVYSVVLQNTYASIAELIKSL
ncbi:MAG: NUDIX domain-containing protein [Sphingobacteriales bacterium JAD_PAG50586_3]|nr:MAG: NUDIX domain-containing protein [Sphingobacteriales bacterium JAD_PAG50586_3]